MSCEFQKGQSHKINIGTGADKKKATVKITDVTKVGLGYRVSYKGRDGLEGDLPARLFRKAIVQ